MYLKRLIHRIAHSPILDKIALAIVIVLLLFITAVLFGQIKTLETSMEDVSNSLMVDKEINTLFSQYDLMESAEFRSVILKDSTFEESYIDRKLESDRTLRTLYDLAKDTPYQNASLDSITQLKDSLHVTLTALHGKIRPSQADSTAMIYVEKAAAILKNLRGIKTNMLDHNERLLQEHLGTYRRLTFLTPLTTLILALFSIVVFTVAYFRLRRHKNQIESSEALLQNIVQSTDNIMNYYEPIYDSNETVVDFRIMFANICNRDYLNLEPEDIIGKPISEVYPFVLENNELERMINCYLNDETIDFEREVFVDGEPYWFHTFVRGMDNGLLEVVRNKTDEYNAKEDLLQLNEQLEVQNFIMSEAKKMAKIGSYTWDMENDKAELSENFYRILDCEPGEFEGSSTTYQSFVHPEDIQQYEEFSSWLNEIKKPKEHVYRIITKKGVVKYLRSKGQFVERDGQTVKIGVVQDVTDQIKYENDLKIKNLELERSNEELESFNRVASHDLQEPLRKIQMFISRLDETDKNTLTTKGREYFDKISFVAARMQSLIRNLLTYSRIGSGSNDFEKIDLNEVLKKVHEDFLERIGDVDAKITSEKLPTVPGVFFQLEQLFSNLISNALKYRNPIVTPKIELTSEKVSHKEVPVKFIKPAKEYYKITVSDNGIGFDNENAETIFEVFQRLHAKNKYSGNGIGLAICKKIVENHHGYIHATSELGHGSSFIMYLPA
ncbi:ATP-binding protein [Flagellimonas iocasae]|uniref:histidine kinase n=1 Tax=Flagellimonas iocasae TaxID=2055905 RepID=A0ABW4XTW8_9FLAO